MTQVMPAEWEPHERTLMAWPGEDLVSTRLLTAAKVDYAAVARVIVRYEPVLMIARPGFGREASAFCGPGVDVIEQPLQDAWLRDSGPLFARRTRDDRLVAVDFLFDGWGGAILKTVGNVLAEQLRIEHQPIPLVLEGGSISVDGQGTVIALAPTVLDRNPGATKASFEAAFAQFLGAHTTVWLEHGLKEDRTGGHADNVVAFIAPGRVICQTTSPGDPNHEGLERNQQALKTAGLDVIALDTLPYRRWAGGRIALPYLNFYLANGCAIVGLDGTPNDTRALRKLAEAIPDREIVGVPATNLWRRGGGPHCITQQLPERRS